MPCVVKGALTSPRGATRIARASRCVPTHILPLAESRLPTSSGNRDSPRPTQRNLIMKAAAFLCVFSIAAASVLAADDKDSNVPKVLDFKMKSLKGEEVDFAQYQGKVLLFVNVASQCGLT